MLTASLLHVARLRLGYWLVRSGARIAGVRVPGADEVEASFDAVPPVEIGLDARRMIVEGHQHRRRARTEPEPALEGSARARIEAANRGVSR